MAITETRTLPPEFIEAAQRTFLADLGRQAAGQSSPALAKGYTDTDRKIFAFIDNPSVSITSAGTFEVHFQFTHFAN